MIRLTRRYRFSASHRLHADGISEAENRALYGKCNNPHGHGHDYVLDVSLRGRVDGETGRVADVAALDRLVRERVLEAFDQRNLNAEVAAFADGAVVGSAIVDHGEPGDRDPLAPRHAMGHGVSGRGAGARWNPNSGDEEEPGGAI